MPKLKTHRGAAKRIKKTGTGKLLRKNSSHSHLLEKKNTKRKKRLGKYVEVPKGLQKKIAGILPYI